MSPTMIDLFKWVCRNCGMEYPGNGTGLNQEQNEHGMYFYVCPCGGQVDLQTVNHESA